jgi:hypothetical protein
MLRAHSVIACFAVVAVAGCGESSEKTGTISGNLTFIGGPVSPTEPHSETPTFHKQPGRVMVLDANGDTVASQQVQKGHGYRFQVAPNPYRLALAQPGGQACARSVRVRQGETEHANVTCQIP